jgi:hypothetical protein
MPSLNIYVSRETMIRLSQAALERGMVGQESALAEACVEEAALQATLHIPFADMERKYDEAESVDARYVAEEAGLIAEEVADKAADEVIERSK